MATVTMKRVGGSEIHQRGGSSTDIAIGLPVSANLALSRLAQLAVFLVFGTFAFTCLIYACFTHLKQWLLTSMRICCAKKGKELKT